MAMRNPAIRGMVRTTETTISGGRRLRTWNDLLYTFPGLLGVKTGHTSGAGWSQVAAARGPGFVVYATLLGEPTRTGRNDDLTRLLAWGISRFRRMPIVQAGRTYTSTELPYGKGRLPLVAAREQMRVVRLGKGLVEEVVAPRSVERARDEGTEAGCRARVPGGPADSLLAARRVTCRRRAGLPRPGRLVRGRDSGQRLRLGELEKPRDHHRHHERRARPHPHGAQLQGRAATPREREADARRRQGDHGGQGAQDPRRPRRRDRPGRWPQRAPHPRGAGRGVDPLRLRPHRGRVADVDGRRRPDVGHVHRGDGVGAARAGDRARGAAREDRLPLEGRRARDLRRDAAARGCRQLLRRGDPYARAPRRLHRARLRGRAAPYRVGGRAVPRLAEPDRGGGRRRPGVLRGRRLPRRARRGWETSARATR